jgi:hypothetical protein
VQAARQWKTHDAGVVDYNDDDCQRPNEIEIGAGGVGPGTADRDLLQLLLSDRASHGKEGKITMQHVEREPVAVNYQNYFVASSGNLSANFGSHPKTDDVGSDPACCD